MTRNKIHKTVILSDIHWNVRHKKAVTSVTKFIGNFKPDVTVLLGDIYDNDLQSTYPKPKSRTVKDLGREIKDSASTVNLWIAASKKTIFTTGNHEERLYRLEGREPGIPSEMLEWKNMLTYFGISDSIEVFYRHKSKDGLLRVGKISLTHGHKFGQYQAFANVTKEYTGEHCIIQGHSHRPQVYWWKGKAGVVNGHLSDDRKQNYLPNAQWTMGFTVIEHFDNMKKYNIHPVTIDRDGCFAYASKVYGL